MKLSDKIRILRKARGLSQEEFGYSISETTDGVSRQTVSDWENGKFEPKLDNIRDIARVLKVSFDVLLDENIDLNDADVLSKVLHDVPVEVMEKINTKVRYSISAYSIDKKKKRGLIWSIIGLSLIIVVGLLLFLGFTVVPLLAYVSYVVGVVWFSVLPISIINIKSFAKEYKDPRGAHIGEINNTHIILHAYDKAANVIYLPLDKIKDIVVDEKATARRGNVIIILAGREKPVTLIDVAFPQEVLDFYCNLIDSEGNPDPIKIF